MGTCVFTYKKYYDEWYSRNKCGDLEAFSLEEVENGKNIFDGEVLSINMYLFICWNISSRGWERMILIRGWSKDLYIYFENLNQGYHRVEKGPFSRCCDPMEGAVVVSFLARERGGRIPAIVASPPTNTPLP